MYKVCVILFCEKLIIETFAKMPQYYKVEINKTEWEIPEKYQMLSPVGSGAYGQVW